ncbi:ABC transporter ATP-binding protein [Actinoplanes sp. NPDC051494]|uniref:ABC transporter ATP-binding protein n=1 Tax=Actinoplanes sp. NPDC051494 TaxID=3363907 RepID=UPI0037A257B8
MPEESPAVVLEAVSHRYDVQPVLDDCTLEITAGAVVGLLGRNGAGKSTLLRVIAGLLRPDTGDVRILGGPHGPQTLPRLGYVGQHAPLYRALTVAQTLRLGARLNPRWDAVRAQDLAGTLPPRGRVGALATGQRTRLALACALGKQPDLLILDEPLAGLDPVARAEVVGALMAEVAERGMTVLISSHSIADIQDVCDHVAVLGAGRIRLSGPVEAALAGHRLAVGAPGDLAVLDDLDVVDLRHDDHGFTALVRDPGELPDGAVVWHEPTWDELLVGYLRDLRGTA